MIPVPRRRITNDIPARARTWRTANGSLNSEARTDLPLSEIALPEASVAFGGCDQQLPRLPLELNESLQPLLRR